MEEIPPISAASPPPVSVQPPAKPKTFLLVTLGLVLMLGLLLTGVVLGQKGFLSSILPVQKSSPTILPQPTPTPDPTAGWQTYTNSKYGFEFKYPTGYLLDDKSLKTQSDSSYSLASTLKIIKKTNEGLGQVPTISLILLNTKKTVEEFLDFDYSKELADWQTVKKESGLAVSEPKIISTQDGKAPLGSYKKVERQHTDTVPNPKETQYLFKKDNLLYIFFVNYGTYNPDTKGDGSEERQTLDQILSTFKFLDQTSSTENWKTYASADYKFSFLYPGSSTIEEVGQKGEWLQVVVDKGKKTSSSVKAMLKFEPNDPDFYLDSPSIGQKTVGENVWKLFSLPKGYGDGPGFSSPLFAWQVKKNSILYTVTFYNQSEISASQEEIISAFKFSQ